MTRKREPEKKHVAARLTPDEYAIFTAEAELRGQTAADYLRELIRNRDFTLTLKPDLEALISSGVSELAASVDVSVRQELRQYRDEMRAQAEGVKVLREELKESKEAQQKMLETLDMKISAIGKGIHKVLTAGAPGEV